MRRPYGKKRFPVDGDIARIAEGRQYVVEVPDVILLAVLHFHDHRVASEVVTFLPRLVRPVVVGPTEAEGKVGLAAGEHFVERPFQQLPAIAEPIVVVAETLQPSFACQLCLLLAYFRQAQVVEAQVGGDARLVVAAEQRLGLGHVGPFREALAPPLVVLWNRVVLREV